VSKRQRDIGQSKFVVLIGVGLFGFFLRTMKWEEVRRPGSYILLIGLGHWADIDFTARLQVEGDSRKNNRLLVHKGRPVFGFPSAGQWQGGAPKRNVLAL
jgi:hypothetical protein